MWINKIIEFNRGDNTGCAYFQMNQKRGRRWSATKAYLQPIRNRKNLTILYKTLVQRVNVEIKIPPCWQFAQPCHLIMLQRQQNLCKKEVILAAGAIGLLKYYSYQNRNAKNLAEVGIELKVDLPGVGENLHDHLQLRSIYSVENTETLNHKFNSIVGKLSMD